uniref:IncF plasmid conjugative transfer pilus assemblyprotein TraF n=1 Tax=Vibrio splendidus TaxID=29497 RepID=A0A0H3ZQP6_VIBSP|nr:IncF plasmid conjugative transfer pilus assemblyprotein TraF [Vibrio splendidus]
MMPSFSTPLVRVALMLGVMGAFSAQASSNPQGWKWYNEPHAAPTLTPPPQNPLSPIPPRGS